MNLIFVILYCNKKHKILIKFRCPGKTEHWQSLFANNDKTYLQFLENFSRVHLFGISNEKNKTFQVLKLNKIVFSIIVKIILF